MSIYDRFEQYSDKIFREAADKYLESYPGEDSTRAKICIDHVDPYIGNMRLIDIDDEALSPFKTDRLLGRGHFDKPAMAGTVCKELVQVSTILHRAAKRWRWIPSAPEICGVDGPRRAAYPLTFEEQKRLFERLPTGWDQMCCLFIINTGVRKQEAFGLKWSDITEIPQLDTFVFILRKTKNGEQRAVICNSIARRTVRNMREIRRGWRKYMFELKRRLANEHIRSRRERDRTQRMVERLHRRLTSGLVFPSFEGRMQTSMAKVFNKAWIEAGLPDHPLIKKGLHNLRHSAGQRLRACDVPDEDRDAILGHKRTNLSQHYALPALERLTERVERLTDIRDSVILR